MRFLLLVLILIFSNVKAGSEDRYLSLPNPEKCKSRFKEFQYDGRNYFYSGHDKELKDANYDWLDARNTCRERCMETVSFETQAEYDFLKEYIMKNDIKFIWTSGRLCDFSGCEGRWDLLPKIVKGWLWSANQIQIYDTDKIPKGWTYTPWSFTGHRKRKQPDNAEFFINQATESCLGILNNKYNDSVTWHDIACYHKTGFICEDSPELLSEVQEVKSGSNVNAEIVIAAPKKIDTTLLETTAPKIQTTTPKIPTTVRQTTTSRTTVRYTEKPTTTSKQTTTTKKTTTTKQTTIELPTTVKRQTTTAFPVTVTSRFRSRGRSRATDTLPNTTSKKPRDFRITTSLETSTEKFFKLIAPKEEPELIIISDNVNNKFSDQDPEISLLSEEEVTSKKPLTTDEISVRPSKKALFKSRKLSKDQEEVTTTTEPLTEKTAILPEEPELKKIVSLNINKELSDQEQEIISLPEEEEEEVTFEDPVTTEEKLVKTTKKAFFKSRKFSNDQEEEEKVTAAMEYLTEKMEIQEPEIISLPEVEVTSKAFFKSRKITEEQKNDQEISSKTNFVSNYEPNLTQELDSSITEEPISLSTEKLQTEPYTVDSQINKESVTSGFKDLVNPSRKQFLRRRKPVTQPQTETESTTVQNLPSPARDTFLRRKKPIPQPKVEIKEETSTTQNPIIPSRESFFKRKLVVLPKIQKGTDSTTESISGAKKSFLTHKTVQSSEDSSSEESESSTKKYIYKRKKIYKLIKNISTSTENPSEQPIHQSESLAQNAPLSSSQIINNDDQAELQKIDSISTSEIPLESIEQTTETTRAIPIKRKQVKLYRKVIKYKESAEREGPSQSIAIYNSHNNRLGTTAIPPVLLRRKIYKQKFRPSYLRFDNS